MLAAVLHTLVYGAVRSRRLLTEQDWFWICFGLAVFWASYIPVAPFAIALIGSHVDWVRRAYIARAVLMMCAFLLITWGILCQRAAVRLPGRS
jgi:hypothetical protein